MRLAPALALALLAAAAGDARASHPPGIWEQVAHPAAAREERARRAVEELLVEAQGRRIQSPEGRDRLEMALHVLEAVDAKNAHDVRLRFALGRVLSLLHDDARAVGAIEQALRESPDDPAAVDAYFTLAICYARLGRPRDESAMYDEFLRRETDASSRANALSNRAESYMVQGDLHAAVLDYRASLEAFPDNVLAHWGLAVALDRSSDLPGALVEARLAVTYDPVDRQLGSPNVFFVPPYDRYWYEALGAMARAQQADSPETALDWWETAVAKWTEYAEAASGEERWRPLALSHRAFCEHTRGQVARRARARSGGVVHRGGR